MQLNIDAAVLISLSSGIVALSTLAYLFGRHNARGLAYLRTLMAGLVIWAILNALELAVTDYETKIWLSKFAYLGPFLVIPSWPFFVLAYNEKEKMLSRPFRVAIWTGSALMLLAVFTNELHNTIWTSVVPIPGAVGNRLVYYHGIAFYLYTAFSYVLIIYGALVLIISAGKAESLYRKQNMLLLYSAAIPLVGNILYVSDLMPLRGVDFTALTFVISGLLITIDIKRYGLLDLLPIARERLFDSLQDAVVVLDNVGRLVDINTVGIKWFLSRNGASEAASAGNWKGESFSELVPELPGIIFMDIQMPVMDGLEATRIIRSVEGNAERTPIVAMTANALAGEKQECLESGMDDFLTKPLKPKDLEYILNRWASKHPR